MNNLLMSTEVANRGFAWAFGWKLMQWGDKALCSLQTWHSLSERKWCIEFDCRRFLADMFVKCLTCQRHWRTSLWFSSWLAVTRICRASAGACPHTLHLFISFHHGTVLMNITFKAFRHQEMETSNLSGSEIHWDVFTLFPVYPDSFAFSFWFP